MPYCFKKIKTDFNEVIRRGFLTEQNVGITEFVGKQKPFVGIVKHRFEDFSVHEINKDGKIIYLENIDEPEDVCEEEEKEIVVEQDDIILDAKIVNDIEIYSKNYQSLDPVMISIDEMDKQNRTMVHTFIRQKYPKLESKTESIDDKKFIKVYFETKSNSRLNNRSQKRNRWPKDRPNYVHFVLYKENIETVQVVNELARQLACTTKNFTFAGSKDKRAITTQMFSAWKTSPKRIWKAVNDYNRRAKFNNKLGVGHFQYQPEPLKLGDLSGNHFEIVLRDVKFVDNSEQSSEDEIKTNAQESIQTIKDVGFINYFGMQRFGSHRIDSHKLGILILKKNFKQLVNEILVEKPVDMRPYNNAREVSFNDAIRIWRDTGDAALAYKKLNYKYTLEGSLLRALAKVALNDFQGALCKGMLRNSRLLYLHAYQSYLWNRTASFRVKEYGLNVMQGDLVMIGSDLAASHDDDQIDGQLEEDVEDEKLMEQNQIKANIPSEQIVLVTPDNIDQYTIYDVVLPIIGGLSKLPTNSTLEYIQQIMKEDDVNIEDFASLSKQWCVNGSYRKLIVKPENFNWEWLKYKDDTKPLIISDLARINQTNLEYKNEANVTSGKLALNISVSLPTSSYATIMLRELTKLSSLSLENKPWQKTNLPNENLSTED